MSANFALRGDPRRPSSAGRRRRSRRSRRLETLLALGFLGCLLVGGLALAALWTLSRADDASDALSPRTLLTPERVVVGLAVRELAGDSTTALISQALQAGELHTAAALLLFDLDATPSGRAALWQQVGRRFHEQGEAGPALVAYGQTVSIGALDVALRSLERSQLLTQAAAGSAAAGDNAAAVAAATQAVRVIAQTPDLLPAQRSQLLQPLKIVVDPLGAPELSAQVDDLLRNPYLQPQGILLPNSWALLTAPPAPDANVEAAADARRLAARALADRFVATGGVDTQPEIEALRLALLAEDQARSAAYSTALATAQSRQAQLGVLLEQERWLVQKLQVAQRAFGVTLVPEWEAAREVLEAELNGLMANSALLVDALAEAQPTPLEQNMLRAEGAQWLALQAELGHYPGADRNEIDARVRTAQSELERLGAPPALPVAHEPASALPGFRIQPR